MHAKYIFRPITKRLSHEFIMRVIEKNIDWLMHTDRVLHSLGLGILSRFLPIVDIQGTIPKYLSKSEQREWVVLDTFDMFSPEYDNPQRIKDVSAMIERYGAEVNFAGYQHYEGSTSADVRGITIT